MGYFITFACYGARLHGDESGSVDRNHNLVGGRLLEPDSQRVMAERREMLQDPYVLDQGSPSPRLVLAAIRSHCGHRGWNLLAIVEAGIHASRELNRLGTGGPDRKRWASPWHCSSLKSFDALDRSLAVAARYRTVAHLHFDVAHPRPIATRTPRFCEPCGRDASGRIRRISTRPFQV